MRRILTPDAAPAHPSRRADPHDVHRGGSRPGALDAGLGRRRSPNPSTRLRRPRRRCCRCGARRRWLQRPTADAALTAALDAVMAASPPDTCLVVRDNGRVLYSRNATTPLVPASTVKLLTGVRADSSSSARMRAFDTVALATCGAHRRASSPGTCGSSVAATRSCRPRRTSTGSNSRNRSPTSHRSSIASSRPASRRSRRHHRRREPLRRACAIVASWDPVVHRGDHEMRTAQRARDQRRLRVYPKSKFNTAADAGQPIPRHSWRRASSASCSVHAASPSPARPAQASRPAAGDRGRRHRVSARSPTWSWQMLAPVRQHHRRARSPRSWGSRPAATAPRRGAAAATLRSSTTRRRAVDGVVAQRRLRTRPRRPPDVRRARSRSSTRLGPASDVAAGLPVAGETGHARASASSAPRPPVSLRAKTGSRAQQPCARRVRRRPHPEHTMTFAYIANADARHRRRRAHGAGPAGRSAGRAIPQGPSLEQLHRVRGRPVGSDDGPARRCSRWGSVLFPSHDAATARLRAPLPADDVRLHRATTAVRRRADRTGERGRRRRHPHRPRHVGPHRAGPALPRRPLGARGHRHRTHPGDRAGCPTIRTRAPTSKRCPTSRRRPTRSTRSTTHATELLRTVLGHARPSSASRAAAPPSSSPTTPAGRELPGSQRLCAVRTARSPATAGCRRARRSASSNWCGPARGRADLLYDRLAMEATGSLRTRVLDSTPQPSGGSAVREPAWHRTTVRTSHGNPRRPATRGSPTPSPATSARRSTSSRPTRNKRPSTRCAESGGYLEVRLPGALLLAIGWLFLLIGLLRVLQTETARVRQRAGRGPRTSSWSPSGRLIAVLFARRDPERRPPWLSRPRRSRREDLEAKFRERQG